MKKEAQARIKINKLLEQAGWRFEDSEKGKANISPAIVAGRLAHELSVLGYQNTWKRFSHLRPRIAFNNPK